VLQASGEIKAEPMFDVEHVARAVLHMASLPLDANILSMTVMATNMPLVGRG
jgi:NADP-dependent 3-hydroxy acid dehydrogenase YdfG